MGNRQSLEDEIFNLKFSAKQLAKEAQKCAKAEKAEKAKVKKAIANKQNDIARIHAENAIRQKSQGLNFLRLASRMDAVCQRMQSAQAMKNLNKSMIGVTKVIGKAVDSMNIEKITKTMDEFEKNFEDLDIRSSVMEGTIQQSTGVNMPEEKVDELMKMVAEENDLELEEDMNDVIVPANKQTTVQSESELEKRFNALK